MSSPVKSPIEVSAEPAPPSGRLRNRLPSTFLRGSEVYLIFLGMVVLATLFVPNFFTPYNVQSLLGQATVLGLLATGQFLVILSGGFDLSVGAVLALGSVVFAVYAAEYGLLAGTALAVGAGALLGLVSGIAVTKGGVPPFIATLGTLGIARGLAFTVSERSVILENDLFRGFSFASIGFVPLQAVVWILIAAAVYAFMRRSKTGLRVYAVGGAEDTARLAGVSVDRVKLLVYTASGCLAGVAGILFVARSGSGLPQVGNGWELDSIAAVVIGGTALFGGRGSLPKAMVGVLIYMTIRNVMNLLGLDPYLQDILKAAVIFTAVGLGVRRAREGRQA